MKFQFQNKLFNLNEINLIKMKTPNHFKTLQNQTILIPKKPKNFQKKKTPQSITTQSPDSGLIICTKTLSTDSTYPPIH